jgi:hypothetical protein
MNNHHRFLSCLLAAVPLLAQDPAGSPPIKVQAPSAEQLFRDAWWAESGSNDVDAALRGYLEATAANGPASVRARALLFAGRLQQRLGKPDLALASFRRLVTEFATETALVNEARTHLRELTAVDLRQNYDEWYERRLFSEEVQLVILGKLEALASRADLSFTDDKQQQEHRRQLQTLITEIEVFGKGAVPALRKFALGRHDAMARTAIGMLFAVGETPPLRALLTHADWLDDADLVGKLLKQKSKEAMPVLPVDDRRARLLAAILEGPDALTRLILASPLDGTGELSTLVQAVLPYPTARARLLTALQQPGLALIVREAIENAFAYDEELVLGAEDWLAVGADPLRAELRSLALARAARALRPDDAGLLDRLLAAVIDATSSTGHDPALVQALAGGLGENRVVELLAWTPERLGKLLHLPAGHRRARVRADAAAAAPRRDAAADAGRSAVRRSGRSLPRVPPLARRRRRRRAPAASRDRRDGLRRRPGAARAALARRDGQDAGDEVGRLRRGGQAGRRPRAARLRAAERTRRARRVPAAAGARCQCRD